MCSLGSSKVSASLGRDLLPGSGSLGLGKLKVSLLLKRRAYHSLRPPSPVALGTQTLRATALFLCRLGDHSWEAVGYTHCFEAIQVPQLCWPLDILENRSPCQSTPQPGGDELESGYHAASDWNISEAVALPGLSTLVHLLQLWVNA